MQIHGRRPPWLLRSRPSLLLGPLPFLLAGPLTACARAPAQEIDPAVSRAAEIAPAARGGDAARRAFPEIAIDAPILSAAPGYGPAAAFDGTRYLVAWTDVRTQRPSVYGARVAADGTVLDPYGIRIFEDTSPPAAGNPNLDNVGVAFDGTNFLVIADVAGEVRGARVSPAGVVLDPHGFAISAGGDSYGPTVGFDGANYVVAWARLGGSAGNGIYWAEVTPDGAVVNPGGKLVVSGVACGDLESPLVSVSFDGEHHFLTWIGWREGLGVQVRGARVSPLSGVTLDPEGLPIGPLFPATSCRGNHAAASFDGANHVVAWSTSDSTTVTNNVHAARVTPSGTVLDPEGILLGSSSADFTRIGSVDADFNGARTVIAWSEVGSDDGGEFALPVRVMQLDPDGSVITPLASELERGVGPSLCSNGAGTLALWALRDWPDPPSSHARIKAARLSEDGVSLDRTPLTLATHANAEEVRAAASDGESFFVVWNDSRWPSLDGRGLYGARISASGEVLDPAGILLTGAPVDAVSVAYDGANYVVVFARWRADSNNPLRAVRVSPGGVVLDAASIELPVCSQAPHSVPPSVASDGAGTLVVANGCDYEDLAVAAVRLDGEGVPGPAVALAPATEATEVMAPQVAFGSNSYLVVWHEPGILRGRRVSPDGEPLAPAATAQVRAALVATARSGAEARAAPAVTPRARAAPRAPAEAAPRAPAEAAPRAPAEAAPRAPAEAAPRAPAEAAPRARGASPATIPATAAAVGPARWARPRRRPARRGCSRSASAPCSPCVDIA
ncbi:hypothetical protein [Sorangium sp. So ce131]|uniref:hypothetical protein n=1 Tax=Sorangium sp. So ce131 TaxID=3133282 RepID=UPI003F60F762